MSLAALAFAAGVLWLQCQAELPPVAALWVLPPLVAAVMCALFARAAWWRILALPLVFATGFLWAGGLAQLRMSDWLAPELEGRDIQVVGVVADLPMRGARSTSFGFEIESVMDGERLPRRLRLAWYPGGGVRTDALEDVLLRPGERWQLTVRLRRPHGSVNPHGFDYEAWLLERGIGATGYVRAKPPPVRLGLRNDFQDVVERAREAARDRFHSVLGNTPAAGILAALAVGEQRAISNEEWRLFQRTGVTHLMSISGLHVTLVSGLAAWCLAAIWRRVPALCLRLPARKAAALAAIGAAFGYALLAGFAVPAQRTCYMVAVVAIALWSGHLVRPLRVLALALAVVLVADPWAVLAPGFWLSFGAVALIFYVVHDAPDQVVRAMQWLRVQWAITVGLAPASLLFFSQLSLSGPVANAVAIPLVSVVVTPLALLAAVLPLDAPAMLGAWLTEWLLEFLEWCAALPFAVVERPSPPLWSILVALAGIAWLLAPRGVPWRLSGLALLVPAFSLPAPAPERGEAWITTLDVGQGLAVLVRTAHHALLYDAGPQYGPDSDSGDRVILPYLRASGVDHLDEVILTHQDTDHIGGAGAVLAAIDVGTLRTALPSGHSLLAMAASAHRCVRGQSWEWDGIRFELLHPQAADAPVARRANDQSCVLRVAAGGHAMLLTGDIERGAEAGLVASAIQALPAEVLLAPHHGSRTSSTEPFLDAVAPRWVVVAVGYRNRFRHPNDEVLARYRNRGMGILRTDTDGAVTVRLGSGGVSVTAERQRAERYWRARSGAERGHPG